MNKKNIDTNVKKADNNISEIDVWVTLKTFTTSSSLLSSDNTTVRITLPHEELSVKEFPDKINLNNFKIMNTSGTNNDCLIHAFLTSVSQKFRLLPTENKDEIASEFRRSILLDIYSNSDFTTNREEKKRFINEIKSTGNLDVSLLAFLGEKYNINILLKDREHPSGITDWLVLENKKETTVDVIIIYNPGKNHFESICNKKNEYVFPYKFIEEFIREQLKKASSIKPPSTFYIQKAVEMLCEYKDDLIAFVNKFKDTPVYSDTYVVPYIFTTEIRIRKKDDASDLTPSEKEFLEELKSLANSVGTVEFTNIQTKDWIEFFQTVSDPMCRNSSGLIRGNCDNVSKHILTILNTLNENFSEPEKIMTEEEVKKEIDEAENAILATPAVLPTKESKESKVTKVTKEQYVDSAKKLEAARADLASKESAFKINPGVASGKEKKKASNNYVKALKDFNETKQKFKK